MGFFSRWTSTKDIKAEFDSQGRKIDKVSELNMKRKLPIKERDFCIMLTRTLYKRILSNIFVKLAYDSREQQQIIERNFFAFNPDGINLKSIIWKIADAIARGADLYLVWKGSLQEKDKKKWVFIREATPEEKVMMDKKVKEGEALPQGYSIFNGRSIDEACLVNAANRLLYLNLQSSEVQMLTAGSPIFRIKDLTRNVALSDSQKVIEQGQNMRDGIISGNGAMMDSESNIDLLSPSVDASSKAFDNYVNLISLYLGLPKSFVIGVLTSGSMNAGEADSVSVENGLRPVKLAIVDVLLDQLFGIFLDFKKDYSRYLYRLNTILSWIESTTLLSKKEKIDYMKKLMP